MFDRYEYEWDDDNVGHIARHDVEPWEAEEAVSDGGRAPFPARGKDRVGAIGTTEDGRVLVVIVQRAERRASESIRRVVMARDATDGEKRIYRRRNR